jgi:hypothetical protein
LGKSFLTAAIISSLVAALFDSMVSMTTCLMVRFGRDSGLAFFAAAAAAGFLLFLNCFPASCYLLVFISFLLSQLRGALSPLSCT